MIRAVQGPRLTDSKDSQTFRTDKIAGNDGNRQTMLGFRTKGAADAWIADDKRLTDYTALWNPISSAARSEACSQQVEAHCSAVERTRL
jgi:hypothetical protein